MEDPTPSASSSSPAQDGRLDSWKEIASYLNRDVTTVQRWEKREGMPVRRHVHDKIGSVYAYRAELDAWVRGRNVRGSGDTPFLPAEPVPSTPQGGSDSKGRRWTAVRWIALAVVLAASSAAAVRWLARAQVFWRSPIADARFTRVTDFEGIEQAAAISRDGRFAAFLSDRDGPMDVWLTQLGSGEFHNLTRGTVPELANPSVRTLGFSPDGSAVTFWVRLREGGADAIGTWSVPTLGGQPRPLFEGVAESDWSSDGARLVYHTPGPGDPMFVTDPRRRSEGRHVFTAPAGRHAHFPLWAADGRSIYFVEGTVPDKLDIWRVSADGGTATRITSHDSSVGYPVFLDSQTLLYLATDPDGSGPWLHSVDVERRIVHRLNAGADRYTSLAASADGRRLLTTVASPRRTLWRVQVDGSTTAPAASRISLSTGTGFFPRLGPDYLLYVASTGAGESIWKSAGGVARELWTGADAQIIGGPAIAPNGRRIAFSTRQNGKTLLSVMQDDGTDLRVVADSLDLQGSPAWAPDGLSITTAAMDGDVPRLFRVPLGGEPASLLVHEYATDPVWARDGRFVVYSGPDVGTTFTLRAVTSATETHPLPELMLTRGARRLVFLEGGHRLVVLRGEIQHKNLWLIDLDTGAERKLTSFAADFGVHDFDISPDGRELVVERVQDDSDIVVVDLPQR